MGKINKIKRKYKIILNILLNYNKYSEIEGDFVKIIKNEGYSKYDKYVGEVGVVLGFEYENIKNPVIVYFGEDKQYCFNFKEFELMRREKNGN